MKKAVKFILAGVAIAGVGAVVADRIIVHYKKKKRLEERLCYPQGKHFKDENYVPECYCDDETCECSCDVPYEERVSRREKIKNFAKRQRQQTKATREQAEQVEKTENEIPEVELIDIGVFTNNDKTDESIETVESLANDKVVE